MFLLAIVSTPEDFNGYIYPLITHPLTDFLANFSKANDDEKWLPLNSLGTIHKEGIRNPPSTH